MQSIGKYEVVEKIGEGGFGTIFKGFDPHIRRFVAIKSCTSEEQEVRSRFLHEAQIAGNLQHRHIVTVYDFGRQDGVPYLVQEYLSGEDLDRKIKRKDNLPLAEKLLYLIQVARGLEYAHSRGVVHRDIKPANIRILEDGTAKIMDFGIAKLADQDTGLTQTGMTLGTAAYLAPEQIRGEPIGPATDIFSWGITAWELISFQRPFTGQHISTVLYQILHEQPPPLLPLAPECPAEIAAIIDRCLEKRPERRYTTCTELLRDFDGVLKNRRLAAQSGLGALVAQSAAELSDTRTLTALPPRPSVSSRTAPVKAAASVADELVELDLDASGQSHRTPHSISTTQAVRSRGFAWGPWVAAVTVSAIALAGIVILVRQSNGSAGDRQAELRGGAETVAATGTALAASAEVDPAITLATPTPAPTPTPEPTLPPTPPPPAPGFLVVPAAWSPEVSVTVNGERRRLARRQTFEVPPGAITVKFEYAGSDFRDTQSSSVRVSEGRTVELTVPILPPGQLLVQQRLNTPPGRVTLDGEDLGQQRVQRTLKSGSHRIRVDPASPSGAAPIEQEVQVPSGKKLIVTYDLTTGVVLPVEAALD